MHRTLITALVVLVLSLAICGVSTWAVGSAARRADAMRVSAERAANQGDEVEALRATLAMQQRWQSDSLWLELMTSHDALSDVRSAIADALACLENGSRAEFLRASAVIAAALDRLNATEAVRLMNLF